MKIKHIKKAFIPIVGSLLAVKEPNPSEEDLENVFTTAKKVIAENLTRMDPTLSTQQIGEIIAVTFVCLANELIKLESGIDNFPFTILLDRLRKKLAGSPFTEETINDWFEDLNVTTIACYVETLQPNKRN